MNAPLRTVNGILATDDTTEERRIALLTAEDLARLSAPSPCIKGVFPAEGLAAVAGPSASGKTFLVLDQAMHIAAGCDWFGHRTQQRRVVYLGLEGQSGLAQRVRAFLAERKPSETDGIRFITESLALTSPADVSEIERRLKEFQAKVLIIDTLSAATPGLDENASSDMGLIIEGAKRLQAAIGGLLVYVHHTGKDASRGLRGHSSLFAAMDSVIEVSRDAGTRSWKLAKSKDGADGEEHPFRLRVVDLGEDDDGDPITSCVVDPEDAAAIHLRKASRPNGNNARIALDAIKAALKSSGQFGMGDAPPTRPTITLEQAIAATAERLAVEPKRRKERAESAISSLVSNKYLSHLDGWIWIT